MRYIVHCDGCNGTSVVTELETCPDCGARLGGDDVMMARRMTKADVDTVSVEMMRDAEAIAEDEYGIDSWSLMQEAGCRVADVIRRQCGRDDTIVVVTGPGNNGGDGLVAACRLAGWGYDVSVVAGTTDFDGPAAEALDRVERMDIPMRDEVPDADIYVDAVFGYGLDGAPRPPYDTLIASIDGQEVIAVDVPSGLDLDSGEWVDPHVEADHTVMLGLPKEGLDGENAGQLWLADIGMPGPVYEAIGVRMPFGEQSLLEL